jgi:hypothetical protein
MKRLAVIALAALALPAGRAHADNQIWTAAFVQARPAPTGVAGWLDLHDRRRADGTLAIVRPAIGYALTKSLLVHAGYGWIHLLTDEGGNRTEHRAWQQVLWLAAPSPCVKTQVRARLEQRFGAGDDVGHRVRLFVRGQWAPSQRVQLQLVGWDEIFVGLNATDWGTPRGYDQNRLFLGVGVDTALRNVRIEAGYMNVVLRRDTQMDHILAVNLFATLAP